MNKPELTDYKGVIHIHSKCSDGSGGFRKILQAAQSNNLDFVIITDHNTMKWKEKHGEGWRKNVLFLVGEEITPKINHFIALDIKEAIVPKLREKDPGTYIKKVEEQNGFGFIAHPIRKRKRSLGIRDMSWIVEDGGNFCGIEIWSYMHDWIEDIHPFNLLYYLLHPEITITGPSKQVLKLWDRLNAVRPTIAIGGLDAHARYILPFISIFPYKKLFSTIRTHILSMPFSGNSCEDIQKVYSALKKGRSYIAYDFLAEASGFSFIVTGANHRAIMGEEIKLANNLLIQIKCPQIAKISLLHNGVVVKCVNDRFLNYDVKSPGSYRVEVYLKNKPWIFSNPIYVR